MINGKKIIVVLPAYNAKHTLQKTYDEIPFDVVDQVILVDDASQDDTIGVAKNLGIKNIIRHKKNIGYGGNQKTCYRHALLLGADIVIMLHPDYQHPPKLIPDMASSIATGTSAVVLGSRMMGNNALKGGMPIYKYVFNRLLTSIQNALLGMKLTEYHTGYRAFSREVLETISYERCSNNFIFDNQILSQIIFAGFEITEIDCPTHYSKITSSIQITDSIVYGLGVLRTSLLHALNVAGFLHSDLYLQKRRSSHSKPDRDHDISSINK
jgi:glycosyltransferase involved in cell wall biosynthesis